ncbi:VOC family protein [Rhodocista pekingensis]|uniref:VOC family protein n=1 Tax=Rhodocista pekingensis TaxID=201185 RepID=A0ABW2KT32_9PROT
MEFHTGRLIDHVHIKAGDLEASRRFYRAVAEALGLPVTLEGEGYIGLDELYVSGTADGPLTQGLHLAFQASDRETVERFHAAAIAAGGRDNGGPGERSYHPGYYAAFVLDPDGNNIEAVYHGPSNRSADSVVITPA